METHDALVADWQENAQKHDDEIDRFLQSVKMRPIKRVDRIVDFTKRQLQQANAFLRKRVWSCLLRQQRGA